MRHYVFPIAFVALAALWFLASRVRTIEVDGRTTDGSTVHYAGWGFIAWDSDAFDDRWKRDSRNRGQWTVSAFASDYGIDPRTSQYEGYRSRWRAPVWFPFQWGLFGKGKSTTGGNVADQYNNHESLRELIRALPREKVLWAFQHDTEIKLPTEEGRDERR